MLEQRHFIAGEIKEPKNIPRSLFHTLIVTVIYILANLAYWLFTHAWHPGCLNRG
jgi:amino acid transporter